PALDVPAGRLRAGDPRRESPPDRPVSAGMGADRSPGRLHRVDRRASDHVHREDRGLGRRAHRRGSEQGHGGGAWGRLSGGAAGSRLTMIAAPPISLGPLMPLLVVLAAAAVVLLLDLVPPHRSKEHLAAIALAGIAGAVVAAIPRWNTDARAFRDMVI